MKRLYIGIPILISALFLACSNGRTASTDLDWIRFSSKEGKFSALMPFQPQFEKEKQTNALGEVVVHIYMSAPNPKVAYSVMFAEFSERQRERVHEHPEVFLAAGKKAALGTNSTLLNERGFVFEGHPAQELQFVRPPADLVTMRTYLTEDRIYTALCQVQTNEIASTNIFRFLNSFHLRK